MIRPAGLSRIALLGLTPLLAILASGCVGYRHAPSGLGDGQAKFAKTSYINEGRVVHLIVDVRSPRLRGPSRWLGIQVAMLNVTKETLTLTPESFVLETPDRRTFPLASYEEFKRDYTKARLDNRVGEDFLESVRGRYPSPPYQKRPLEFFPPRDSGIPARDRIDLRPGQMGVGWIYFSLPEESPLDENGRADLLVRPPGEDETWVIGIEAYKETK